LTVNRALFYGVGMKFSKTILFPVLALMLSGCAGYRAGSTLPKSIRTVSLSIVNKTDEPSIEVAVMKALRAELQMDGRLEVRSQNEADAVLCVTLTRFDLDALAFNRRQGTRAEEYRMTLTASAVLSDAESKEVLQESPVVLGESEFPYVADLTSAKRSALPEAAGDLARKVVSATVTAW
jgi:outer membrane lipopolysaccharide assembly protein LptE/RlpB